jgi:putative membrane protein
MKFLRRGLFVATVALCLTALAFAQDEDPFMSQAAQDGMAKIQWAYLALQNSQNEQVKLYAQQILSDYANSQNDLIFIANQHAVILPQELAPKDRDTFEALSQLQGAAFDKAYMKAMLTGRQAELSKFKQDAAKAGTPGIAEWANQTLPALQNDLKEAKKIAPAVGVHLPATSEAQPTRGAGQASSKPASENPY